MRWLYLALWGLLAWQELPPLWREGRRRELTLWLALAGAGLALAVWYFWGDPQWRLAEWLVG
ncbi:MAG: hypothetical protein LIO95_01505 [Clostridiales bacterium]|nr:hypothetical protein [Clostridiales bacterium]